MSERILWLGGNKPRHLYYINELVSKLPPYIEVVGGVMQGRGSSIPERPRNLKGTDAINWSIHFKQRDEAEAKYFGKQLPPDINLLNVTPETLNSPNTVRFVEGVRPDLAIVFGTGMIREPLLSALPKDTINLHLGLSPRYRGAATLFWPQYMLEPNWAGTTFHYIVDTPDGGDIIHQAVPELIRGDGIHDVACKAVIQSTKDAILLFDRPTLLNQMWANWPSWKQKPEAGKNFLESDFQPKHLRVIYQTFGNKMVDAYLDGEITPKEPKLRRQF